MPLSTKVIAGARPLHEMKVSMSSLAVCCIVKNEGRYLMEWIAYHLVAGVDHFIVYDNDSDDGTEHLLAPLVAKGICTYIPWPREKYDANPSVLAYRNAVTEFSQKFDWIAFIDPDEFIVTYNSSSIPTILDAKFSDADAIACSWKVFGSSGEVHDDGRLCIERFVKRGTEHFKANRNFKTIARPTKIKHAFTHNMELIEGRTVLSDGTTEISSKQSVADTPVYGYLHINHYYCKSHDEFLLKRSKGRSTVPLNDAGAIRPLSAFGLHDVNDVEDLGMVPFVDRVKAKIDEITLIS